MFAAALIQGCDEGKANAAVEQVVITVDQELNARQKVTAHMKAGDYDGLIGIKLRGNSSLGFNQKKYTVELIDEQGKELDAELLGMPAHSDWVLLAPYNDVSAVRDPLAFQLWRDMGHWAPRTRMVELTLNGDYRGIYILSEAIKRGKDRVDIAKMKKGDTAGLDVTGGYLLRIDTYNDDDATFTSKVPGIGEGNMTSQVIWSCIYPKKKKLQPEQFAYIQNYVDTVEQVIQSEGFADPKTGYARYIDVPSFVDYFIHTELSLNADGYKRSAYFYKEKQSADGSGGKLVAGPVWDYNLAYGNANYANANNLNDNGTPGESSSFNPHAGNGRQTQRKAGLDYNIDDRDKRWKVSGNAQAEHTDNSLLTTTDRQNFLSTGDTYEHAAGRNRDHSIRLNTSHTLQLNGKRVQTTFRPSMTYSRWRNHSHYESSAFAWNDTLLYHNNQQGSQQGHRLGAELEATSFIKVSKFTTDKLELKASASYSDQDDDRLNRQLVQYAAISSQPSPSSLFTD